MRTLLDRLDHLVVWGLFFATTVYGHVALKLAAGGGAAYDCRRAWQACASLQGASALLAWAVSGFLWAVLLTRNTLVAANSISVLRYLFVCLAAWLFLREEFRPAQAIGIGLIAAGLWFLFS
jgi:EamA domain-containing membrane protein RarD